MGTAGDSKRTAALFAIINNMIKVRRKRVKVEILEEISDGIAWPPYPRKGDVTAETFQHSVAEQKNPRRQCPPATRRARESVRTSHVRMRDQHDSSTRNFLCKNKIIQSLPLVSPPLKLDFWSKELLF